MTDHLLHRILLAVFVLMAAPIGPPASAADEPTVLITGSNRGIGLEIARVYATRGWTVIATCRSPEKANDLQAIAASHDNLVIEELDVTDDEEIAALAATYDGQPIDIVINNAAISGDRMKQSFGKFDFEIYEQVMRVNVHGPLKMAEAFMDNVEASEQKKFINISSTQGSVGKTAGNRGLSYFYKSSKSALHMVMRALSIEMKSRGITIGLVSPGWVDTNFGGMPSLPGMITAAESGAAVVAVIDDYGLEQSGTLMSHKGEVEPW